jgi:ribosome maturation factor RimP
VDASSRIRTEVGDLLRDSGYELVDVETGRGSRGLVVRVIVDKPGGVSVEDCARVSRAVGDRLEAGGVIPGRYVLEVSSPGIDRPLKRAADYERFVGETVEIVTHEKIEGRHHYRGVLDGFDAALDAVRVRDEQGGLAAIPLSAIRKANLRRDPWPAGRGRAPKPSKGKRKR